MTSHSPPLSAEPTLVWIRIRDDVTVTDEYEDRIILERRGIRRGFGQLGSALKAALHQLRMHPAQGNALADVVAEADGPQALAQFWLIVTRLAESGFLTWIVLSKGKELATVVPLTDSSSYPDAKVRPDAMYVISRFAHIRRIGFELALESPRALFRFVIHEPNVILLLHTLREPTRVADLASASCGLCTRETAALLRLLIHANMVVHVDDGGTSSEDNDPTLQTWEFHDLLFHCRSRNGRHDQPIGGTYRFLGKCEQPPALRALTSGKTVALQHPDIEKLQREDFPFAYVQEARHSIREYGPTPLTCDDLGVFLYRVARIREHRSAEFESIAGPVRTEFTSRPYPGAGALYELEIYPIVNRCGGLAPGMYRYDPLAHRLEVVAERTQKVQQLLRYASRSINSPIEELQVLMVLSARFARVAWKYTSVAYSLVLKDVGVVLQTMYLVATAMNLAPCALGGGDADVFAQAAGTDYFTESSVGEFLLGSKN